MIFPSPPFPCIFCPAVFYILSLTLTPLFVLVVPPLLFRRAGSLRLNGASALRGLVRLFALRLILFGGRRRFLRLGNRTEVFLFHLRCCPSFPRKKTDVALIRIKIDNNSAIDFLLVFLPFYAKDFMFFPPPAPPGAF